MTRLHDAIEQYIDWMRSHGARFVRSAETLRRFARTVGDEAGCDTVSHEHAAAYLSRGALRASSLAFEYYALAGFYRYAAARGIATRSPLPAQPPQRSQPFPAYIFSDDEVRRLLAATEESRRRATQLEVLNPTLIRGIVASKPGLSRYGLGGKAVESGTRGGSVECWS